MAYNHHKVKIHKVWELCVVSACLCFLLLVLQASIIGRYYAIYRE